MLVWNDNFPLDFLAGRLQSFIQLYRVYILPRRSLFYPISNFGFDDMVLPLNEIVIYQLNDI